MASPAGYSATPLAKKLGLKDGQRAGFIGLPETLSDLSKAVAYSNLESVADWTMLSNGPFDYLHMFTKSAADLTLAIPALEGRLHRDGMLWVSWPKKAAKVATDVTGDVVREVVLHHQLVDIKVCAVDAVWSGLKMMIRKDLCAGHRGSWQGGK